MRQALQANREAVALTWLARLQLATTQQILALGWPGVSRASAIRRLHGGRQGGLFEAVVTKSGGGQCVVLHRLTPAGAVAVATLLEDSQVIHGVRVTATEGIHLEHRLRVNDTILHLVDRVGQDAVEVLLPHQRRLRWQISGGAWHEVTPDVVLVFPGTQTAFMLEYDRGLRSLENIAVQLQRYREAVEQPDLPSRVARSSIVYVLHPPSPRRATAILQAAADAGVEARVTVIAAADLAAAVVDAIATSHPAPGQATQAHP